MSQQFSGSRGTPLRQSATAEEYSTESRTRAALEVSKSRTVPQAIKGFVQQHPAKALLLCAALGLTVALLLPGNSSTDPD